MTRKKNLFKFRLSRVRVIPNLILMAGLFAVFFLTACGNEDDEASIVSATQESAIETFTGETFVDAGGWTWIAMGKVEYVSGESVPEDNDEEGEEPAPEKSVEEMTLEEIAEYYRPIMEFEDVEYWLSEEDTLDLAKDIFDSIGQSFSAPDNPGTHGTSGADGTSTHHQPIVLGGTDDRVNVNSEADMFPHRAVAGVSTGPQCTAFKMLNNYTAITAAHCVYSRSEGGWMNRQSWWFGAGNASRNPLASGCYARTIPYGWTKNRVEGTRTRHDFAIIRFRTAGEGGPWCNVADYAVGWLGYRTTGSGIEFDAKVQGYPDGSGKPPGNWSYPTLWRHTVSGGGWTNNNTYPNRVFHRVDASGGQSGAPIRDYDRSQVRGIHKGHTWFLNGGYRNQGRRMSSDLITWFQANQGS